MSAYIGGIALVGTLLYAYIVFMGYSENAIHKKWLYTIPVWPLALIVLLIRVSWLGIKVIFRCD